MPKYIIDTDLLPATYNHNGVDDRARLAEAFIKALPADPVTIESDHHIGPCVIGAGGRFYLQAQGTQLFAVDGVKP